MTWLKIALPVHITPEMDDFANKIIHAIEEIGDIAGTDKKSISYGDIFFSDSIVVPKHDVKWISVSFAPPKPGVLADISTPTWRMQSGNGEFFIRIYDTIPPKHHLFDIKKVILHELVHAFDPKLNKPDLFNTEWHKKHRKNISHGTEYTQSNEYFNSPWEQDAHMAADAYSQVAMWKRNTVPYIRVVEELQNHMPWTDAEFTYKENPKTWLRYLKTLYKYVHEIYKDEIPKNKSQLQKAIEEWERPKEAPDGWLPRVGLQ